MKLRPELLQHPNIPKPMHGLNPRTLLGKAWWDKTRFAVQERQGYHCAACGVAKAEAWPSRWLECHEDYTIDYAKGRIEINDFVALCPACHKFIHSGFLAVTDQINWDMKKRIMNHGWNILKANKMNVSYATFILIDRCDIPKPKGFTLHEEKWSLGPDWHWIKFAKWQDWRMILDGKGYKSLYANEAEWAKHYGR